VALSQRADLGEPTLEVPGLRPGVAPNGRLVRVAARRRERRARRRLLIRFSLVLFMSLVLVSGYLAWLAFRGVR